MLMLFTQQLQLILINCKELEEWLGCNVPLWIRVKKSIAKKPERILSPDFISAFKCNDKAIPY